MKIYEKLLVVQKKIGVIVKDEKAKVGSFSYSYFDINSLLASVKPVLNDNGLVLLQGLTHIEGKLALSTMIAQTDEEGEETIEFICPLPDTVDAQKAGSAITYFRRYALQSLLALEAEDDDGSAASAHKVPAVATTGTNEPITTKDTFKI